MVNLLTLSVAVEIVLLSKSQSFRPHSTFDTKVQNTYRGDSAVGEAAIDAASESKRHNANFCKVGKLIQLHLKPLSRVLLL